MNARELMQYRKIVTFSLLAVLTVELITGVILFLKDLSLLQEESLPYLVNFKTIIWLHEWVGYATIIFGILHIALNWKVISKYPKLLLKSPVRKSIGLSLISIGGFSAITGLLIALYFRAGGGFKWRGNPNPGSSLEGSVTLFGLTRSDFIFWHEWISLAIIALISFHIVLNRRILKFYIYGPKKKPKAAKTSIPYLDLASIKHVLLIHNTGLLIHYENLKGKKLNAELLSGLLSALKTVAEEVISHGKKEQFTIHKYDTLTISVIHGNFVMAAFISEKPLSRRIANEFYRILNTLEQRYSQILENWSGDQLQTNTFVSEFLEKTHLSLMQKTIDLASINKNKYSALYRKLQQIANSDKPLTLLSVVPLLGYKEFLQLDALIKNNTLRLIDNSYKV